MDVIYVARALGNYLSEESTNQTETDAAGDVPNTTRTEKQLRKQSIQYLTRFDNVPTPPEEEREILLIQQSITTYSFFKDFQGRFSERYNT